MREVIKSFDCAKEFLDFISPRNRSFGLAQCIFRGQGNSEWPIIPSAFRKGTKLYREGSFITVGDLCNRRQIEGEYYYLEKFSKLANRDGLNIGEFEILSVYDCSDVYMGLDAKAGRGEIVWPRPEFLQPMAQAQHYGLPTRMIDWSYNIYVAAYFASKSRLSLIERLESEESNYISVFSIDLADSHIRKFNFGNIESFDDSFENFDKCYQMVSAPTYNNANLKAQEGVFIVCAQKENDANSIFETISLEEYYFKMNELGSGSVIKEIRLHHSECGNLLNLLSLEGVHYSSLFPGAHGVVESIKEREFYS